MKRWWSVFFPCTETCWFCSSTVSWYPLQSVWQRICSQCRQELNPIDFIACDLCGRSGEKQDKRQCFDCRKAPFHVINRSVVTYTEWTRQLLWRFKFKGDERLAEPLGRMMAEQVLRIWRGRPFVLTYVPITAERLSQRGFNQAERLASVMGRQLGLPVAPLLQRKHFTEAQSQKGRAARISSLSGDFSLRDQVDLNRWSNRPILIVDDIYTTGTTLRECARPLRGIGMNDLASATFAR